MSRKDLIFFISVDFKKIRHSESPLELFYTISDSYFEFSLFKYGQNITSVVPYLNRVRISHQWLLIWIGSEYHVGGFYTQTHTHSRSRAQTHSVVMKGWNFLVLSHLTPSLPSSNLFLPIKLLHHFPFISSEVFSSISPPLRSACATYIPHSLLPLLIQISQLFLFT